MARGSAKGAYWQPKDQRDSRRSESALRTEVLDEVEDTELSLDLERVLESEMLEWDYED